MKEGMSLGRLPLIDLIHHVAGDRLVVEDHLIFRELRYPVADREERFVLFEGFCAIGGEQSGDLLCVCIRIDRVVLRRLKRIHQKLIQHFGERLVVKIISRPRNLRPAAHVRDRDLLEGFFRQELQAGRL